MTISWYGFFVAFCLVLLLLFVCFVLFVCGFFGGRVTGGLHFFFIKTRVGGGGIPPVPTVMLELGVLKGGKEGRKCFI